MLCSASVRLALATASLLNGMQSLLEGSESAIDKVLPGLTAQNTPTCNVNKSADRGQICDDSIT